MHALLPLSLLKVILIQTDFFSAHIIYPALPQRPTILSQHTFVSRIIEVRSHPVAKLSPHFLTKGTGEQFESQGKLIF